MYFILLRELKVLIGIPFRFSRVDQLFRCIIIELDDIYIYILLGGRVRWYGNREMRL